MRHSLTDLVRHCGAGLRALLVLTLLTGVLYPLAVTGVAQAVFPEQANGSTVEADGREVGSELIGQRYLLPPEDPDDPAEEPRPDPRWFQPRPSNGLGTNGVNTQYELLLSGATNLAADSPELTETIAAAREQVVAFNSVPGHPVDPADVPPDAVTSSGSGLDPHISPEYAELQVGRVAAENDLPAERVAELVEEHTEGRALGFLGEPRVNVLRLNVALDALIADR
ncbi:potassium-transporting ATPase subunit KdpC [Streptomyces sp. 3MP-14]|uniref:Potassium-transporting ATPase KdpC subunit n=1 Tax=Streptomyces mimosae TaxID=2586635 RepID=A0A5N6A088_9ACTN|nr:MULTISPECIES: potassium-transporting ATPase subunit KdpC [Streptomyces]KAB8162151.1 potassium-transporting ATPase subunit KdpC [Streptomyces mimosae]KAB8173951.1 potassium-transporting ATPase subunit KdpC [Streptomyces sp. 3MP-14]